MAQQLRSEDLSFLERAPVRRTRTRDLHAPAEAIFEQLAAHQENWPRWFGPANECHYVGPPPYGVGTVRFLRLYKAIRAHETVLVRDPAERFAYWVRDTNVPGLAAMMEQWNLTPLADGRTRVSWTMAVDCSAPVRLMFRATQRHVDKIFQEAMKRLERLSRHS
ncbi:Polyketide cyclase / dehydrase and lipid transport [Streptomyces sp. cf386]|nr:Polyketide cyclase / dehydrase and lipid transport [Streptomyces sp. cf386]